MIVSSALMIWKGLMVVTGSESPIVVVLSGSMEPAFHRGDLLFLTNYEQEDIRVGEIVVFKVKLVFAFRSNYRFPLLFAGYVPEKF
jgi:signal peptidase